MVNRVLLARSLIQHLMEKTQELRSLARGFHASRPRLPLEQASCCWNQQRCTKNNVSRSSNSLISRLCGVVRKFRNVLSINLLETRTVSFRSKTMGDRNTFSGNGTLDYDRPFCLPWLLYLLKIVWCTDVAVLLFRTVAQRGIELVRASNFLSYFLLLSILLRKYTAWWTRSCFLWSVHGLPN